jgi:hypothetical protein
VRLVERHAGAGGEERGESDLLLAEKLRREHGVEEGRRAEAVPAKEEAEVVVGAVHEEPPRSKAREESGDVEGLERVHEIGRAVPGELQKADLLEVVVEGVRLRVERDVGSGPRVERGEKGAEGVRVEHEARVGRREGWDGHHRGGYTAAPVHPQRASAQGFRLTPPRFEPDTRGGNKWLDVAVRGS